MQLQTSIMSALLRSFEDAKKQIIKLLVNLTRDITVVV